MDARQNPLRVQIKGKTEGKNMEMKVISLWKTENGSQYRHNGCS